MIPNLSFSVRKVVLEGDTRFYVVDAVYVRISERTPALVNLRS